MTRQIQSGGRRFCKGSFAIQKQYELLSSVIITNVRCMVLLFLWGWFDYAEAHHLRPLGYLHNGPDLPSNMLVLCPNHHAQCDLGAIRLNLPSLRQLPDHVIDAEYIQDHTKTIAK
ncbi:MAG: hypothetical protein LZF60_270070 [Nitrospira sp.]|nr:MAG: hypothetical protein LZF60_270070 [Nitrospira sp.]